MFPFVAMALFHWSCASGPRACCAGAAGSASECLASSVIRVEIYVECCLERRICWDQRKSDDE